MIDTLQSQLRQLITQQQRERTLTRVIIDAAQNLKDVSGDPSCFLLAAARVLDKAISDYEREVLYDRQ